MAQSSQRNEPPKNPGRFTKVRDRGLKKNTLQLKTLFALSNLWMVRHQLLAAQG